MYRNDDEEQVCFNVEVRVPYAQAEGFAAQLSGDDDDIILAAETAIRKRLGRGDMEVELWPDPGTDAIVEELRQAYAVWRI